MIASVSVSTLFARFDHVHTVSASYISGLKIQLGRKNGVSAGQRAGLVVQTKNVVERTAMQSSPTTRTH